jgi:hypothetical protein
MILPLAAKYGGVHHGAFLPHEGPNNIAVHLFSFPSLPISFAMVWQQKYRPRP